MSNSHRHVPITGITTTPSDKPYKRAASKRVRRAVKMALRAGQYDCLPRSRELTCSYMGKDGKVYWTVADIHVPVHKLLGK